VHGWFNRHKQHHKLGKHHEQQQLQQDAVATPTAAAAAAAEASDELSGLFSGGPDSQQQQQQWLASPSPLRGVGHVRSHSRCQTPSSGNRPLSRAVSVKPSFAQPIDDLRLPNR
jgi:hypothetical protein